MAFVVAAARWVFWPGVVILVGDFDIKLINLYIHFAQGTIVEHHAQLQPGLTTGRAPHESEATTVLRCSHWHDVAHDADIVQRRQLLAKTKHVIFCLDFACLPAIFALEIEVHLAEMATVGAWFANPPNFGNSTVEPKRGKGSANLPPSSCRQRSKNQQSHEKDDLETWGLLQGEFLQEREQPLLNAMTMKYQRLKTEAWTEWSTEEVWSPHRWTMDFKPLEPWQLKLYNKWSKTPSNAFNLDSKIMSRQCHQKLE